MNTLSQFFQFLFQTIKKERVCLPLPFVSHAIMRYWLFFFHHPFKVPWFNALNV